MNAKSLLKHNKFLLVLAQIVILGLSMAIVFWLMVAANKDRIESDLRARLDASTQAMAAQLKANQVPFSATTVEPGVFIINQTDGTVVIDRRNDGDTGQKLWEGYKTKIIYEMQKQKRGWIEYPDKNSWNFNKPQRIIRYTSIDELNWILAVEDLKPSSWDLLKDSVNPSTCLVILFIFVLGGVILWLMTVHFFDRFKRQISDSMDDNLLSLNGEEKFWGKSQGQSPKMNEIADPIMEEIFHKPPVAKVVNTVEHNIDFPIKEKAKEKPKEKSKEKIREVPKTGLARTDENKDMAVDVQHINSPVLKKILQQFREK